MVAIAVGERVVGQLPRRVAVAPEAADELRHARHGGAPERARGGEAIDVGVLRPGALERAQVVQARERQAGPRQLARRDPRRPRTREHREDLDGSRHARAGPCDRAARRAPGWPGRAAGRGPAQGSAGASRRRLRWRPEMAPGRHQRPRPGAFQTGIWLRGGWAAAQCEVGLRSQAAPCAGPGGGGTSLTNLRVGELGAGGGTSLTTACRGRVGRGAEEQRLVTPLPGPQLRPALRVPAAPRRGGTSLTIARRAARDAVGWDFAHDRGRGAGWDFAHDDDRGEVGAFAQWECAHLRVGLRSRCSQQRLRAIRRPL